MPYSTEREGRGRWVTIQKPAAGVLWTDDDDCVGFEAAPNVDPAPVQAVLDTAFDAGRSATEAFEQLATLVGARLVTGDLGHWIPDRNIPTARRGLEGAAADFTVRGE